MKNGGDTKESVGVGLGVNNLIADAGLSATTAANTTYTPDCYYSLNGKQDKKLTADVTAAETTKADVYIYAQTANVNNKLNESVALTVDGKAVALPTSTFQTIGCRSGAKSKWIPIKLANVDLAKGKHTVAINEATSGKGIDVSHITVIPTSGKITTDVSAPSLTSSLTVDAKDFIANSATVDEKGANIARNTSVDMYVLVRYGGFYELNLNAAAPTESLTHTVNKNLAVAVNGNDVECVADKHYNEYGCGENKFGNIFAAGLMLSSGMNKITVKGIGDYGCCVKSVTLNVCDHDYKKTDTTLASGETAFDWYVCGKCGLAYNKIQAEKATYNIKTASNIKSDTIKLGNSGDWIETKVYVNEAMQADVRLTATVSDSSSVYPVSEGLNVIVNGKTQNASATGTYGSYGLTSTVFADIPLATVNLVKGVNTIRVNRYGDYGCTVDYIRIVPEKITDRSSLATTACTEHGFEKDSAFVVKDGETAAEKFVCSNCGLNYNQIKAVECTSRNIQKDTDVTDETVKLGQAGDRIEFTSMQARLLPPKFA